jgi:hypothetical protein
MVDLMSLDPSSRDTDNIIACPSGRTLTLLPPEGIPSTAECDPCTPAAKAGIAIPAKDNSLAERTEKNLAQIMTVRDFIEWTKSKLMLLGDGTTLPMNVLEATGKNFPMAVKIIDGAAGKPKHERSSYLEWEIRKARNIRHSEPGAGGDWPANYEDQFWAVYPRQIGKESAMEELRRLRKEGASFTNVIMGAERYSSETKQTEEKFIKHPANWLREGRWFKESERACA